MPRQPGLPKNSTNAVLLATMHSVPAARTSATVILSFSVREMRRNISAALIFLHDSSPNKKECQKIDDSTPSSWRKCVYGVWRIRSCVGELSEARNRTRRHYKLLFSDRENRK